MDLKSVTALNRFTCYSDLFWWNINTASEGPSSKPLGLSVKQRFCWNCGKMPKWSWSCNIMVWVGELRAKQLLDLGHICNCLCALPWRHWTSGIVAWELLWRLNSPELLLGSLSLSVLFQGKISCLSRQEKQEPLHLYTNCLADLCPLRWQQLAPSLYRTLLNTGL